MTKQLYADHIGKAFRQGADVVPVLNNISVLFESNHTYALMGISGTGKSTLLYLLAGLEEPTSGIIYFNSHDIRLLGKKNKRDYLYDTIGLIFQFPYLLPELSVIENVMLKGLMSGEPYRTAERKALDLLDRVGLADKARYAPGILSGGEQQRVAIVRALFNKPLFLLADEPTAHLDEKNRVIVLDILCSYQRQWSMGLLVATHDPLIAARMETTLELSHGSLRYFPSFKDHS
jgi:lipoprotein-releasing system ATP-binding protein